MKKKMEKNGKKRISFKIKSRYFELVTAVTTKLLESTKKKDN